MSTVPRKSKAKTKPTPRALPTVTLEEIRLLRPCKSRYRVLLQWMRKNKRPIRDSTVLTALDIMKANGAKDLHWLVDGGLFRALPPEVLYEIRYGCSIGNVPQSKEGRALTRKYTSERDVLDLAYQKALAALKDKTLRELLTVPVAPK